MNDMATYIREQLAQKQQVQSKAIPKQKNFVQPQKLVPKEDRPSFLVFFLAVCVLLMSFATAACVLELQPSFSLIKPYLKWVPAQKEQAANPSHIPPVHPQGQAQPNDDWLKAIDKRLDRLEKNAYMWHERIWMLSLATNENAILSQRVASQFHGIPDSGYIQVDKQWQLNRMPQNLKMTEDHKNRILNHKNLADSVPE